LISVVIATFNGSKYIEKQLKSILIQISKIDEVIIIDDCSKDNTLDKIRNLNDNRVHVFQNSSNLGHVKSFEKGLILSKGEYIYLSDQDDFWLPNKVHLMNKEMINKKLDLLISSFYLTNTQGEITSPHHITKLSRSRTILNIVSIFTGASNYYGSMMCLNRVSLSSVLPFPKNLEAHDLYLALKMNINGQVGHLDKPLVIRTITGHNLSNSKRTIRKKIYSRILLFKALIIKK